MVWDDTVHDFEQTVLSPALSDLLRKKYHTPVQLEYNDREYKDRLTGLEIEGVGHIGIDIGLTQAPCFRYIPHGYLTPNTQKALKFAGELAKKVGNYRGLVLEVRSDKPMSCG